MKPVFRPGKIARAAANLAATFLPLFGMYAMYTVGDAIGVPQVEPVMLAIAVAAFAVGVARRSTWWPWPLFITVVMLFKLVCSAGWQLERPVHFEYAIALDRLVGAGELPTLRLQSLFYHGIRLHDALFFLIYATYFVTPYVVLMGLWLYRRALAGPFVVAFGLTVLGATVVFLVIPTGPPWMAGEQGHIQSVSRIGEDLLRHLNPAMATGVYGALEGNQVAAFPSLHVAITTLCALAIGRAVLWARKIVLLHPLLMTIAVVYLGEHYLVDAFAGSALACLAFRVATRSERWMLPLPRTLNRAERVAREGHANP